MEKNKQVPLHAGIKIGIIVFIAIVSIISILLFSCEQYGYHSSECCWTCGISTTYYHPDQQPSEIIVWGLFDTLMCDWTYSQIDCWEESNTWSDTIDGIWTVQQALCRK